MGYRSKPQIRAFDLIYRLKKPSAPSDKEVSGVMSSTVCDAQNVGFPNLINIDYTHET